MICTGKAEVAAPTIEELEALLLKIITRVMRLLVRQGFLIEEQDMTYLAEADTDPALLPLCKRRRAPIVLRSGHELGRRC